MDIEFTQEQILLKDTVRSFIRKEYDEETTRALCLKGEGLSSFEKKLVQLGISGMCFPERYGGEELGPMDVAVVIEALSRYSMDLGMACGTNLAAGLALLHYGSETLKKTYLPRLSAGKASACFGYAEPFCMGAKPLSTITNQDEKRVQIHIHPGYCENKADRNGLLFLPVDQDGQTTLAIVPLKALKDTRPVKMVGRNLLGQRFIPAQVVTCKQDQIFSPHKQLMPCVLNALMFSSVLSIAGNMNTVVHKTIQYAKQRQQFGQPIGKFQAIAHMLVDAKIGLDSTLLYGYWLAWHLNQHEGDASKLTEEATMANVFASAAYNTAVNTSIQVMGGYGYMNESHMERYARDARMTTFYPQDGYSQKMTVAKHFDTVQP